MRIRSCLEVWHKFSRNRPNLLAIALERRKKPLPQKKLHDAAFSHSLICSAAPRRQYAPLHRQYAPLCTTITIPQPLRFQNNRAAPIAVISTNDCQHKRLCSATAEVLGPCSTDGNVVGSNVVGSDGGSNVVGSNVGSDVVGSNDVMIGLVL